MRNLFYEGHTNEASQVLKFINWYEGMIGKKYRIRIDGTVLCLDLTLDEVRMCHSFEYGY
jgi:hypothetical protein